MKREDVTLTPEESRRYEKFSVLETQKDATHRPIASTDATSVEAKEQHRQDHPALYQAVDTIRFMAQL